MERTVADTIKDITYEHLTKNNGLLLGQVVSNIGWINHTVPDCPGVIELPMSDVVEAGFAVGTALVGRRPILVIRYQDFVYLHASILINYAAKTKEIFGVPAPMFIRLISSELAGFNHSGNLYSIFMHVPGIKVASPMTPLEYQEVWNTFMSQDDPIVVSEHRDSLKLKEEMPDIVRDDADITIFLISVSKLMGEVLYKTLLDMGVKSNIVNILWLKPLELPPYIHEALSRTKVGLVVEPDYELVGASQSIAYKLMYETGLKVKALGAPDRCITAKKSNKIIPTVEDVVREVYSLLDR